MFVFFMRALLKAWCCLAVVGMLSTTSALAFLPSAKSVQHDPEDEWASEGGRGGRGGSFDYEAASLTWEDSLESSLGSQGALGLLTMSQEKGGIQWHPFLEDQDAYSRPELPTFGLVYSPQGRLAELRETLMSLGLDQRVELRVIEESQAAGYQDLWRIRFFLHGVPFCSEQLQWNRYLNLENSLSGQWPKEASLYGLFPEKSDVDLWLKDWGSRHIAADVRSTVLDDPRMSALTGSDLVWRYGETCWHWDGIAFELVLVQSGYMVDQRPGARAYGFSADNQRVYALEPALLNMKDVTASAEIYRAREPQGVRESATFRTRAYGRLVTDKLLSRVDHAGFASAFSVNVLFNYPESDPRFGEVSAFAHTQSMLLWFEQMGFQEKSKSPIEVRPFWSFSGNVNNAAYQSDEFSPTGRAMIMVGEGDGVILQNLTNDPDVVSHELAHHVVFKRYKARVGDGAVIQEGLADAFTFLRSRNSCLGERICPEGTPVCWQPRCLRTAENDLKFETRAYQRLPFHQKGQALSGMIWDLANQPGWGFDATARWLLSAVNVIEPKAGFNGLFYAMLQADQALHSGKHRCSILKAIESRGFAGFLGSPITGAEQCGVTVGPTPALTSSEPESDPDVAEVVDGRRSCGVVGSVKSSAVHRGGVLLFLLLMAMPWVWHGFTSPRQKCYQLG